MDEIFKDVFEINRRLFNNIWNLADTTQNNVKGLSPKLVIPRKRDNSNRVSEQEARFLFTSLLNTTNYFYSVETPTEKTYKQSGQKPISAASDLSLYINDNNTLKKVLNIEFKAHNPSKDQIKKDIEKLIKEDIPGCWNHLFKNIDSGTIPALFQKIKESINELRNEIDGSKEILFSICVIDKKIGFQRLLDLGENDINDFFKIDYSIKNENVLINIRNEWMIHRYTDI